MARSLHAIEFDFQKALRQARELDRVAQRLNSLSDSSLEAVSYTHLTLPTKA